MIRSLLLPPITLFLLLACGHPTEGHRFHGILKKDATTTVFHSAYSADRYRVTSMPEVAELRSSSRSSYKVEVLADIDYLCDGARNLPCMNIESFVSLR